jgi:poly-gamma-glutamate synthesis protein (capsule biosynthesis protein)
MTQGRLPWTFKDVVKLSPANWLKFNATVAFFRLTRLWDRGARYSGDLEKMKSMDLIYWYYKAIYPIKKPRKELDVDTIFSNRLSNQNLLPQGFRKQSGLSLASGGDLMPHAYLKNSRETLYKGVSGILFGADISMANLECVVSDAARAEIKMTMNSSPPLHYDFESFDVAKGCDNRSFSFLATACNHSLDLGFDGLRATAEKLANEKIFFHGINVSEDDAFRATLIEKNGLKVGLIAHTFGLNAKVPPPGHPHAVNRTNLNEGPANADLNHIDRQIAFCKINKVDFLILHLHWGLENEFYPVPEQIELAHVFAERGVDLIIGHHPHVIQPVEFYRTRRDENRIVPVFYSLGNLINPFMAPHFCHGYIAQIQIAKGLSPDGAEKTYVEFARAIDTYQVTDHSAKTVRIEHKA